MYKKEVKGWEIELLLLNLVFVVEHLLSVGVSVVNGVKEMHSKMIHLELSIITSKPGFKSLCYWIDFVYERGKHLLNSAEPCQLSSRNAHPKYQ